MIPPITTIATMANRRPAFDSEVSIAIRPAPARTGDDAWPFAPRRVDVGWFGVASAVRNLVERSCELVEGFGAEHAPHFVGRDRRAVADRAAIAQPQQPRP